MPISSIIINVASGTADSVANAVNKHDGATVMEIRDENIIAVLDTPGPREDKILWETIKNESNVINLDLIYHNFEDVEGPVK